MNGIALTSARGRPSGKQPGVKSADRQRHQRPRRERNADRIAGERAQAPAESRSRAQQRVEKPQFEHHDRKKREQYERRGLPHVRRPAGRRIGRHPTRERRVDALRLEALDEIFGFLRAAPRVPASSATRSRSAYRIETQHRRPTAFVLVRRLHERTDVAGKALLRFLNAVGERAIRSSLPALMRVMITSVALCCA